jgi:hypothetical protein
MLNMVQKAMKTIEGLDEENWIKLYESACELLKQGDLTFSECLIESLKILAHQTSGHGVSDCLAYPTT